MIAIVTVATGPEPYPSLARGLASQLHKYFPPHDFLLLTDSPQVWDRDPLRAIRWPHFGANGSAAFRYHAILSLAYTLEHYTHIFVLDADLKVIASVLPEEVCGEGITAVSHYNQLGDAVMPVETNPQSNAAMPARGVAYYHGCFIGGERKAFLAMAEQIVRWMDEDYSRHIVAAWFEESYLNKYLWLHPPAKVLTPAYCYPETNAAYYVRKWGKDYAPKVIQIDKRKLATHA